MPYRNIVFIKLFWKEILYGDDRFTDQLNDDQKGLFLMLFLLLGATENHIKNDAKYIKRVLNLSKSPEKIRKDLDKILEVFPKCVVKDGYIKFKNFNKLRNRIEASKGTPRDAPGTPQGCAK